MRIHELALQKWLSDRFFVAVGFPVPVVFSSPMDAYSQFQNLLNVDTELRKIYEIKDDNGTPLFMPYPAQTAFPLLSVMRKSWAYRTYQNFSTSREIVNWPTISPNVSREQLGNVTTRQRPMAWDFKFQIDFHCMRPDTQAMYVERLMRAFLQTSGNPQTWIPVAYPGWGTKNVRMFMESSSIENTTSEEPEDGKVQQFRTTVQVVIEGWSVDIDAKETPALWTLLVGTNAANKNDLESLFSIDLRIQNDNKVMLARENVPPNDPALQIEQLQYKSVELGGTPVPSTSPVYIPPINNSPSVGIPSIEAFGIPTVVSS